MCSRLAGRTASPSSAKSLLCKSSNDPELKTATTSPGRADSAICPGDLVGAADIGRRRAILVQVEGEPFRVQAVFLGILFGLNRGPTITESAWASAWAYSR